MVSWEEQELIDELKTEIEVLEQELLQWRHLGREMTERFSIFHIVPVQDFSERVKQLLAQSGEK